MKLIKEWREAWKFSSVQTQLISALVSVIYALVPAIQSYVPLWIYIVLMVVANLASTVLRIISQGITDKKDG